MNKSSTFLRDIEPLKNKNYQTNLSSQKAIEYSGKVLDKRFKRKTVMIFGSFDFLHAGHFHFFEFAKKQGDKLVVVIARDKNIEKIKGKKPFHSEADRKKMLAQIRFIDEVYLGDLKNVYKIIRTINPDIIALGYDQEVFVENLARYLKENNFKTKIVRAKPYKSNIYKSSKMKKYLERFI